MYASTRGRYLSRSCVSAFPEWMDAFLIPCRVFFLFSVDNVSEGHGIARLFSMRAAIILSSPSPVRPPPDGPSCKPFQYMCIHGAVCQYRCVRGVKIHFSNPVKAERMCFEKRCQGSWSASVNGHYWMADGFHFQSCFHRCTCHTWHVNDMHQSGLSVYCCMHQALSKVLATRTNTRRCEGRTQHHSGSDISNDARDVAYPVE